MCFAPQQRALFRHLNFQKRSERGVFCTFWLRNVLRATMACTFLTSQLLKGLRSWGVLYILTWKRASRHNGVQSLISHVASWLRTRRFSEPTFRPSGATNHWKNTLFRDFPTFSRTWIFFLLRLSLFWSSFFFLLFCDSSHLCFSSVHIVGSLISKLPSASLCNIRNRNICSLLFSHILQRFSTFFCGLFPPLAIHWGPSCAGWNPARSRRYGWATSARRRISWAPTIKAWSNKGRWEKGEMEGRCYQLLSASITFYSTYFDFE